jgi:hypothetical protein
MTCASVDLLVGPTLERTRSPPQSFSSAADALLRAYSLAAINYKGVVG